MASKRGSAGTATGSKQELSETAGRRGDGSKKYQIFLSSTFTDLVDERRAVTEVILSMNHIPVGMELFEAGNEDQWTYIRNRILEIDYYLVIVAERYGSIGPHGLSYTEMEYQFAVQNGVPVAALLLDKEQRSRWPAGKIDFESREKVNAFRDLCMKRMVSYWSDTGSLTTKCQLALNGLFRSHPRVGWISADQAISPQLASELARLSGENSELRAQVAEYQAQVGVDRETETAATRLQEPLEKQIRRASRRYPDSNYTNMLGMPAVVRMLSQCSLFDLIMNNAEAFFDGCSDAAAGDLFHSYLNARVDHSAEDFAQAVAWPIIGVMTLLMRSWGLVETFNVEKGTRLEKWLKLSPLGRRGFDEALSRFLDNDGSDISASPR